MKKLVFGLIATVMISSLSYGQRRINKPKTGYMAVGDVIAGAACLGLGPYGVLWGGFMGSCGAAVLWNDMFSRNTGTHKLTEPNVVKNPNKSFDNYALVGQLHNDLMIKYCNQDVENNVFTKQNRASEYIKGQMLDSKYFNVTISDKEQFVENLSIFDNLFYQMNQRLAISDIVDELNKVNKATEEEQVFYNQIIDFTLSENPIKPSEVFEFVNNLESSIKSSNLKEESKSKLFYSLEILRYSYALWYENIQE
ncbi:hypothetical protein [Flavobacterium sp.]|uniref:hypothetical protein n=1 Tax=Flavobacterium sp. TaxID=239 RepID=UPI002489BC94|nr:hypothetical protein [Flavobacterium sp.]MDI1315752.1 hypothetical protein [Flavobacterium sp.]